MIQRQAITAAAIACIVIVPFIFESHTFSLYKAGDPDFFTYSGARLWVFLAVQFVSGFFVGLAASVRPATGFGMIALAVGILTVSLHYVCDDRQCYYSGPDGFSGIRMGILFFATSTVGLMTGTWASPSVKTTPIEAMIFGTSTAVFLGYYLWALLFATYLPSALGVTVIAISASVPFVLAGLASRQLTNSIRYPINAAATAWAVLSLIFAGFRPTSVVLIAIMLPCALAASAAGFRLSRPAMQENRARSAATASLMLAIFALGAAHPFADGPMSLRLEPASGPLPGPTYYSGAYHESDKYFPTKRVEVEVNLTLFDPLQLRDFLFAGIGAQSPNCCKDGLDYAYRADLLFNASGGFLVGRAWETCDSNIACSGLPWISLMHKSVKPFEDSNGRLVVLAMEWQQDEQTVAWQYKLGGSDWQEFGRFVSPEIENPYFNLGVIPVGNPVFNPPYGNAYFFQAGVSSPDPVPKGGVISFNCPAYYDADGNKLCAGLEPVIGGSSHWKVLWKWGAQGDAKVKVDGSRLTVKLG